MKKVIVIGSPGSGKSTFSRKLRDLTNLPIIYLDMLWHKADKTTVTKDQFDQMLFNVLKGDSWIIDGNYDRTLELRLKHCDTVFLLDLPSEVCLTNVKARINTKREDMPWVEDQLDEDFKQYILDFPNNKLPKIYELIASYKDLRNIYIFKSRQEIDDYIANFHNKKN